MKLTVFFLFASFFGLQANTSYSQKTVTLNFNEITVSRLLNIIETRTDFRFVYKIKDVELDRKIKIKAKKEKIPTVLDKVFKNAKTIYKIFGDQIFLRKKQKSTATITGRSMRVQETITVTGTITEKDTGMPIPGANILEKGTTNGVMTDFDGNYSIDVPKDAILEVSYVGFAKQQVKVGNRNEIDVVMVTKTSSLDEVVVVGYGTQKKSDLTGSISTIDSESIEKVPVTNPEQALAGKASGVKVSSNSGRPGGNTNVRIRGNSSINASNDPL